MKSARPGSGARSGPSFQSDVVIDEEGEVFISFFGPELLHLVGSQQSARPGPAPWPRPDLSGPELASALDSIRGEYAGCVLCPKACGFDRSRSSHPTCGDWQLKVSNYGISFGDEADLSRGGGSGIIFLSGCPLTCPSCINEEKVRDFDALVTLPEFLYFFERLHQKGVNNIQILSPTVFLPHLRYVLALLRRTRFPVPVILKSSGYESLQEMQKLRGLVDIYLPDYKFSSSGYWKKKSGAEDYHSAFVECLKEMHQQVGGIRRNGEGLIEAGVLVRHVTNPFLSVEEKAQIAAFLRSLPADVEVSLLDNFVVLD